MSGHGAPSGVDPHAWLGPDPELALVEGDLDAWLAVEDCECHALCTCDKEEERL